MPPPSLRPSLRRAAAYSLQGALCTLVPIPFLDDLLMRQTRRRLVRDAAARHQVTLRREEVAVLSQTRDRSFWGCVGFTASLLVRIPLRFLRRLLRTILFFLAARDATAAATRLFHESVLLDLALEAWPEVAASSSAAAGDSAVLRLRAAMDRTWLEVDPRPIRQAVRTTLAGSWSLLRSTARALGRQTRRLARKAPEEAEVAAGVDMENIVPAPLLDRLAVALSHEGAYLQGLAERFRRHWPAARTDSGGGSPGSASI